MKGVQCYELFGGIALKNDTFSIFFISISIIIENFHVDQHVVKKYLNFKVSATFY